MKFTENEQKLLNHAKFISALMAISGILSALFIIGIGELKQRLSNQSLRDLFPDIEKPFKYR
ncbi:MAG: hypothetical protein ABEI32_16010 [Halothece sp.]